MEKSEINKKLTNLVEAHDVAALEKAIPKDPSSSCQNLSIFGFEKPQSIREYLKNNKSAVERACELGFLDMVTVFLQNGCSPNLPTSDGRLIHSVLNCLKSRRELVESGEGLRIVSLMISSDCDLNVKDYNHKSPLMMAAELADGPIMGLVLPSCMDWQLYPRDGFTPLHMTCMQGNIDCVRQLVSRMTPASLNTRDEKMYTPFMYSVKVLNNNFDLHMTGGPATETRLWIMQHKHMAIIEFLLASGASCLYKDEPSDLHYLYPYRSPVGILMDVLNAYELVSFVTYRESMPVCFLDKAWDLPAENSVLSSNVLDTRKEDKTVGFLESQKKPVSPYSSLMRLLIHSGLDIFQYDTFQKWTDKYYHIQTFFLEVKNFIKHRKETDHVVPSLLSLCRSSIRLQSGKVEKLHKLPFLPLPQKLICYVMFIDF